MSTSEFLGTSEYLGGSRGVVPEVLRGTPRYSEVLRTGAPR